jgi:hypothetical protein
MRGPGPRRQSSERQRRSERWRGIAVDRVVSHRKGQAWAASGRYAMAWKRARPRCSAPQTAVRGHGTAGAESGTARAEGRTEQQRRGQSLELRSFAWQGKWHGTAPLRRREKAMQRAQRRQEPLGRRVGRNSSARAGLGTAQLRLARQWHGPALSCTCVGHWKAMAALGLAGTSEGIAVIGKASRGDGLGLVMPGVATLGLGPALIRYAKARDSTAW